MLVHGAMKQKITMRFPWEGRSTSRKQACREPQLGARETILAGSDQRSQPHTDWNILPS